MKKVTLEVKGMHCKSCEQLIKMALEDIGAKNVSADHAKGVVVAEFDSTKLTVENIKEAVEKEGYEAV